MSRHLHHLQTYSTIYCKAHAQIDQIWPKHFHTCNEFITYTQWSSLHQLEMTPELSLQGQVIILSPPRFSQCHGVFSHLWAFSFNLSHTCIARSLHNLQSLSYVFTMNANYSSFVPQPSKKSHVGSSNGDFHTSNRNDIMWRWNWREMNTIFKENFKDGRLS